MVIQLGRNQEEEVRKRTKQQQRDERNKTHQVRESVMLVYGEVKRGVKDKTMVGANKGIRTV